MKIQVGNQWYFINKEGQIQRLDMTFTPSDSWKITGIRHVHRHLFVPLDFIEEYFRHAESDEYFPLLYKNGNSQWRICDIDHGTFRIWGQGIKSILFE